MKATRFSIHSNGEMCAIYEQAIARAHRAVYFAMQQAEALHRDGAQQDLESMLMTLTALGQDALARRPGRRRVT